MTELFTILIATSGSIATIIVIIACASRLCDKMSKKEFSVDENIIINSSDIPIINPVNDFLIKNNQNQNKNQNNKLYISTSGNIVYDEPTI